MSSIATSSTFPTSSPLDFAAAVADLPPRHRRHAVRRPRTPPALSARARAPPPHAPGPPSLTGRRAATSRRRRAPPSPERRRRKPLPQAAASPGLACRRRVAPPRAASARAAGARAPAPGLACAVPPAGRPTAAARAPWHRRHGRPGRAGKEGEGRPLFSLSVPLSGGARGSVRERGGLSVVLLFSLMCISADISKLHRNSQKNAKNVKQILLGF